MSFARAWFVYRNSATVKPLPSMMLLSVPMGMGVAADVRRLTLKLGLSVGRYEQVRASLPRLLQIGKGMAQTRVPALPSHSAPPLLPNRRQRRSPATSERTRPTGLFQDRVPPLVAISCGKA